MGGTGPREQADEAGESQGRLQMETREQGWSGSWREGVVPLDPGAEGWAVPPSQEPCQSYVPTMCSQAPIRSPSSRSGQMQGASSGKADP